MSKAIGIGVFTEGAVGRALGIDRVGLTALGFDGKPGQACVIAGGNGATRVALGLGTKGETTVADVRKAAGAFVAPRPGVSAPSPRASSRPRGVDPKAGAQAVVEGASLGSYSFAKFKSDAAEEERRVVHARHSRERGEIDASRRRPRHGDRSGSGDGRATSSTRQAARSTLATSRKSRCKWRRRAASRSR